MATKAKGRSLGGQRSHQEIETYQALFYKTNVGEEVQRRADILAKEKGRTLTRGERLTLMRAVSRELYELEPENVKAAVAAKMAEKREAAAAEAVAMAESLEGNGSEGSPQQHQR